MASSTSLKELSKAIHAFVLDPVSPLPDDLIETIAAYLRRHQKYDEAASDRLQEELISIYDKHVKDHPVANGAWVGLLRRLLPVLQTPERILQWFDIMKGTLERMGPERGAVDETLAGLMALITHADEYRDAPESDNATNPIVDRLFSVWMERLYPAFSEGRVAAEYNERMLREALSQFGKRRPKEFFITLNSYFVKRQYRKAALRFFCDFIQTQPPHLHQVMQTALFANILICLQQDTSTPVVSAALTALIMLLPHMPSSLVPHLPSLFNIYARLLFWNRERTGAIETPSNDLENVGSWETCAYVPDVDGLVITHLPNYYTILYGLYPINFMDYIRKPQRYLRHANSSDADEIEVQPTEIRHQSEGFRRNHLLHPNFYTLTIDSEKTDFGRWIKSEAAEVVAECMSLSLLSDSEHFAVRDQATSSAEFAQNATEPTEKDGTDLAILSGSLGKVDSWRNRSTGRTESVSSNPATSILVRQSSQSSHPSFDAKAKDGPESPTANNIPRSSSHTQLQDMIQSNKVIKSSLHQSLANDSVPSLALSHQDSVVERPAGTSMPPPPFVSTPMSLTDVNSQVANLQRHILLLQNDLSFERYLKQQHMAHIGDLRRRQLVEAASEAEAQNLLMMNRNLKSRYEEAKKIEMQVRKESEKSRAMAKKWEADLATKLKNLRDEWKKTNAALDKMRRELEDSRQECEKLRKMVCDAEVRELNYDQSRQLLDVQASEVDRMRAEVERLTLSERDNQAKELAREAATAAGTHAQNEVEALKMRLTAQENEVERTRRLFQSQVATLQEKLATALEAGERPGVKSNVVIEGALAASRARQAELQRQHDLLLRKYTALQSSLLDMQSGATPGQLRPETSSMPEDRGEYFPMSTSPVVVRTRPHRGISDPDATSFNVTPPLDMKPPSSSAGLPQRPGSPLGTESSTPTVGPSESPETRFYGRGGLGNRMKKDTKDKQSEDGASRGSTTPGGKKDKKTTGLRGIRGFVQ